ncbi:MAG: hypothetical protein Q9M13_06155, partial [Mariprofundales bacterium]|nr:hypothetical protein [Mariprofundales bacterium]
RRLRRIQVHFLLRRLLRSAATVLLPTAGRAELFAYSLLPRRLRQRGRVVLYVHQMRMDGSRFARLQWIARRAPEARILTTTDALAEEIRGAGFSHVQSQPCPFSLPPHPPEEPPFRHAIFPGMARMDKSLPLIVELIELMKQQSSAIPLLLQAAPNHHGEYAADVAALLQRIRHIGYPHLRMPAQTISGDAYLEQFVGAICLQPYLVDKYANKISGITLDALARGSPVVVRKGIWSAALVERFGAGIVVDSGQVTEWLGAIEQLIGSYRYYQLRCKEAYGWLKKHHSADSLLTTIRRMP